jgi:hypothetical protein
MTITRILALATLMTFGCGVGGDDETKPDVGAVTTYGTCDVEDQRRCRFNAVQVCDGGQWVDLQVCEAGYACRDGYCATSR